MVDGTAMSRPASEALPGSGPSRIERDRLLARVAFEAIWELDVEAGTLRWTAGLSMFGYAPEDVSGDISWWTARLHPDDRERALFHAHEALSGTGTIWSSDYRFRRGDGSWASVAARGVIERNCEGRAVFVLGAMIDVSRAKETEDRLRDMQRLLVEALRIGQVRAWEEDLRAGVVRMDVAGLGGEGQPACEARPREEAFRLLIHPDDLPRLMALRQRTIETGGAFETEHRTVLPDGTERMMLVRGEFVRDSAGKPERILGTSLDITERKRTEEALQKSQRLLQLVLDTLPVGVVVLDRKGDVMLDNAASTQIWGGMIVSGRERWKRSVGTWSGSRKPVGEGEWASERALQQGKTSINELIDIETMDGKMKTIQNSAAPIRDEHQAIIGAVVVNEDVSERVRVEGELRKSEALLREAEAFGQTGSWEYDLVSGEIYSSKENQRIFFGDEHSSETRAESFVAMCHPDDLGRLLRRQEELREQGAVGEIEYRTIRPDGSVRWILGRAGYVREESGKPVRAFGTNTDITERKLAGEELERRLRQHAAVAQLGQSALNGGELQPLFEEAVGLVARSSGFDFAEVSELMPDQTLLLRAGHGWRKDLAGKLRLPVAGSVSALTTAAGKPRVVEDLRKETRFTVAPIILEQGVISHAIVEIGGVGQPFGTLGAGTRAPRTFTEHDLNFFQSMANVLASAVERERASRLLCEQREQTQALSRKLITAQEAERRAVARELHDDFGQVLTAIKLNLQRRDRDDAESIALVDGAIVRMRDLAQDLRPPLLDELGLESSLRWYFEREARRAGLEFQLALGPLLARPSLEVETSCFRVAQEALTNIIRHAQARCVALELRAGGPNLFLEVRDDGKGFDVAEARKRAVRGGSQGLLSMQERVALASGELQIESTPGRGTTLRARLPLGHRRGP
jgi:PAS domain S-box-containing protein